MTTRAASLRGGSTIPRRRSGAARPRTAPKTAGRAGKSHKQSTESFAALGRFAMRVPDARLLDRLIRGRLWIGLIAGALVMLVFMQVSLLKLNTGISANLTTAQQLERENAELRASVSSLDSGQRIQDIAAARGMVMPDDGQLRFLQAGPVGNGSKAAQAITAPDTQGAAQRAQAMAAAQQQQQAAATAAAQTAMTQQAQATGTSTTPSTATSTTPSTTSSAQTTTSPSSTTATSTATATPPVQ